MFVLEKALEVFDRRLGDIAGSVELAGDEIVEVEFLLDEPFVFPVREAVPANERVGVLAHRLVAFGVARGEPFVRRPVALVGVAPSVTNDLVHLRIVQRSRVRQDVVHIDRAAVEQLVLADLVAAIGAVMVLPLPQLDAQDIRAARAVRDVVVVKRLLRLVPLRFDITDAAVVFFSLLGALAESAGHLDVHGIRAPVFSDDRIDHLAKLHDCPTDDRIGDLADRGVGHPRRIGKLVENAASQLIAAHVARRMHRRIRLVVAHQLHARFEVRHELFDCRAGQIHVTLGRAGREVDGQRPVGLIGRQAEIVDQLFMGLFVVHAVDQGAHDRILGLLGQHAPPLAHRRSLALRCQQRIGHHALESLAFALF